MIRPEPTSPYDPHSGLRRFLGVLAFIPAALGSADRQREFPSLRGKKARVSRSIFGGQAFGTAQIVGAVSSSLPVSSGSPRPEGQLSVVDNVTGEIKTTHPLAGKQNRYSDPIYKLLFVRNSLSWRGRRGED